MMASGDQCRLALTAFADPSRLWPAVSTLLDAGVPADDLYIVGLATLMASFAPPASITDRHPNRLISFHQQAREWSGTGGNGRIVATSEPLLELALQAETADRQTLGFSPASSKSSSDLEDDARGNLVTLIVRSFDAQQQQLATRSLLANAQRQVVTYEQLVPVHQR